MNYYHNPKCSKSRAGLELLLEKGKTPTVIEYLKTGLSANTIKTLSTKLNLPISNFVRKQECEKLNINTPTTEKEWLIALENHPILLERPILETKSAAIIGRPPENVLSLI